MPASFHNPRRPVPPPRVRRRPSAPSRPVPPANLHPNNRTPPTLPRNAFRCAKLHLVAPNSSRSPRPFAPCLFCSLFPVPFLPPPSIPSPKLYPNYPSRTHHQKVAPNCTPLHLQRPAQGRFASCLALISDLDVWTVGRFGISLRIPHSAFPTPPVHQVCGHLWPATGVSCASRAARLSPGRPLGYAIPL